MNEPVRNPESCGIAITSLVLGILAHVCFGPLTAIPAVICGHIALSRIKQSQGAVGGQGLAIAGLVLGYVNLAMMVLLIPLMVAIALPNFIMAREKAMAHKCEVQMNMIKFSIDAYQLDNETLPPDLDSLKPDYITIIPTDPWGNEYIYRQTPGGYELISPGRDGIENDNDIVVEYATEDTG
jgi:competence protein ComGC